jgi:L-amino acid N-acyltransferase YncA
VILREATDADAEAIAEIYGHHVIHGLGTFEEIPPSVAEIAERMAAVRDHKLPWLVAEEGEILGYAYAAPYRPRSAYRYAVEDSVYVSPAHQGRGVGRRLLEMLVGRCEALGLRQMIAVIGDSANVGSIALHARAGFEIRGSAGAVGYKAGRWVDIVWMQRALGPGASQAP